MPLQITRSIALSLLFLLLFSSSSFADNKKLKNIILLIGDGMGAAQIGLLEYYARLAPHSIYMDKANGRTAISRFSTNGRMGLSMTEPADALVVDSACSATQLATGSPSRNGLIGTDANGKAVETVLERAKAAGKATGLVSDTRITHATPAAFAAHQSSRKKENAIADDLLRNQVDVMLSGGLRHWLPQQGADALLEYAWGEQLLESGLPLKSRRKDGRDLLQEAYEQGYALAFNRRQLAERLKQPPRKLLGLFASSAMLDGISDHQRDLQRGDRQPTLAEMSLAALEVLQQNPQGFFLMIEGGQIDWAGHNNDAGSLLHEMVKFDTAIEAVHEWAKDRDDTLVIITGDHETGGFAFSYSRKGIPTPTALPGDVFAGAPYQPAFNYGSAEVLDRLYAQTANFPAIWDEARGNQRIATAAKVLEAVNRHSAFKIDLSQALDIVQREANHYRIEGRGYLAEKTFPAIHDFKEFYVYGDEIHYDLMGRALAADQNVVWSTGTHTGSPVPYVIWGPEEVLERLTPLTHHREIGETLKQLLQPAGDAGHDSKAKKSP